ncbi:NAD(P)-binding protein [Roridomyces roridus]|uniref:NAD(P)-binding protein n=1 Tax=Roridomyces roridus TaxID=1738132 RepID=A0AAD7CFK9_9AGAR|nr:NAD(P)-binding protein [Roridomyces roridus]
MRAFVVHELQHPSKITLTQDWPEPKLGKNDVMVDVYSAGLNFYDILQAQGRYQVKLPLPFTMGSELAGRVAHGYPLPAGCPFKAGDRVFGTAVGSYADKAAVDISRLLPLPDNLTFDQGAGLFVTWPTSYEALVGRANLQAGEWVLVTAAAGGVGMAAVQIAKALGAKVIAAAGSQSKLDIIKKYGGADYTVDYTKPGWQKEVTKITGGKGADVIYDPVGMIRDCLKCIAWKGRALVVGFAAGSIEQVPSNLVLLKNISLVGIHWGAYAIHEPKRLQEVYKILLDLLGSGRVPPPVIYQERFTLERLSEGLGALEGRKTWGKAIVKVKEEVEKAKL